MMLKAPQFWHLAKPNWQARLLSPLQWFWRFGGMIKTIGVTPYHLPVPVICVGSIWMGGSGKTPMVLSLARYYQDHGVKVHIISRGYLAKNRMENHKVNIHDETPQDCGDEPYLMAQHGFCVWVGQDRVASAKLAVSDGAEIIIMDDGLQNPSLYKNMSMIVLNAKMGFGNRCLFPSGPLRQTIEQGLKQCQAVVWMVEKQGQVLPDLPSFYSQIILTASLNVSQNSQKNLKEISQNQAIKGIVAFAGIAYPDKFHQSLEAIGYNPLQMIAFPDHHLYQDHDMEQLLKIATTHQAQLVTTTKDAVKLPEYFKNQCLIIDTDLIWHSSDDWKRLLQSLFNPSIPSY